MVSPSAADEAVRAIGELGTVIDDEMGDEVRVTVIAAGFDRWEEKSGRPPRSERAGGEDGAPAAERVPGDLFGDEPGDDGDGGDQDRGDDEFDVPSFLK